jgi:hypothetical protein
MTSPPVIYFGGEYGSGVPGSMGGYLLRLSINCAAILMVGAATQFRRAEL